MKKTRQRSWIWSSVLIGAAALPFALISGCGSAVEPAANAQGGDGNAAAKSPSVMDSGAKYNAKGELLRPQNHREWIFVGAPVTPNDMNDGKAAFPEFHNVYIDPASFSAYRKSGEFPNGTVILKELVSVGGKSMASGNGYFQGEFVSLEAMVKDADRFQSEPGGWAFFRFGEAPDYNPIGTRMETASCNACHSGANQDYVFTDTYPVLRAARTNARAK